VEILGSVPNFPFTDHGILEKTPSLLLLVQLCLSGFIVSPLRAKNPRLCTHFKLGHFTFLLRHPAAERQSWTRRRTTNISLYNNVKITFYFQRLLGEICRCKASTTDKEAKRQTHTHTDGHYKTDSTTPRFWPPGDVRTPKPIKDGTTYKTFSVQRNIGTFCANLPNFNLLPSIKN